MTYFDKSHRGASESHLHQLVTSFPTLHRASNRVFICILQSGMFGRSSVCVCTFILELRFQSELESEPAVERRLTGFLLCHIAFGDDDELTVKAFSFLFSDASYGTCMLLYNREISSDDACRVTNATQNKFNDQLRV